MRRSVPQGFIPTCVFLFACLGLGVGVSVAAESSATLIAAEGPEAPVARGCATLVVAQQIAQQTARVGRRRTVS